MPHFGCRKSLKVPMWKCKLNSHSQVESITSQIPFSTVMRLPALYGCNPQGLTFDKRKHRNSGIKKHMCIQCPLCSQEDERLFLVAESSLRELLSEASCCDDSEPRIDITTRGTWAKATTVCSCGSSRTWSSQPWVADRPLGNILLCTSILFSGVNVAKAFRMLDMLKVPALSRSQYFRTQKEYLFPAVNHVSSCIS